VSAATVLQAHLRAQLLFDVCIFVVFCHHQQLWAYPQEVIFEIKSSLMTLTHHHFIHHAHGACNKLLQQ
jgi:hypothetical protein